MLQAEGRDAVLEVVGREAQVGGQRQGDGIGKGSNTLWLGRHDTCSSELLAYPRSHGTNLLRVSSASQLLRATCQYTYGSELCKATD